VRYNTGISSAVPVVNSARHRQAARKLSILHIGMQAYYRSLTKRLVSCSLFSSRDYCCIIPITAPFSLLLTTHLNQTPSFCSCDYQYQGYHHHHHHHHHDGHQLRGHWRQRSSVCVKECVWVRMPVNVDR
jgi:hypothetical protein